MAIHTFPHGLNLTNPILTPPDRRDLLDYAGTNTIQSSRYINPATQDFQQSSNNHYEGMNFVEQEVSLALSTTFNSSIQNGFGQAFLSSPVISPYVQKQMNGYLNQALSYLISNNLVVIQGSPRVSVNVFGQVSLSFYYLNTSIGSISQANFTLPTSGGGQ